MHLVTREKTVLPIGDSGFFVNPTTSIFSLNYPQWEITRFENTSLYTMKCHGARPDTSISDEFCSCSKNYTEQIIFDADDKIEYDRMFVRRINDSLVAIFDIEDENQSWQEHNTIIIKNLLTNKKYQIKGKAPIHHIDLDVVEKTLYSYQACFVDQEWKPNKIWRCFIDKKGNLIYSGFCWKYKFNKKRSLLSIKRSRTSRKWKEIFL